MKTLIRTAISCVLAVSSALAAMGVVTVTPDMTVVNTTTSITVTVVLGFVPLPICGSVNLQRLVSGQWQTVVPMYDDGSHGDLVAGDGVFTAQLTDTESSPGSVSFR